MSALQVEDKLFYLACPYSHEDKAMQEYRFAKVSYAAGTLTNQGNVVYSPIAHCHPLAERTGLPGDWRFWQHYNNVMLERCDELWVLTIEGWEKSTAVYQERKIAAKFGLPVKFLDPDTYEEVQVHDDVLEEIDRYFAEKNG